MINSDKVILDLKASQSFQERRFVLGIVMKGVTFTSEKGEDIVPSSGGVLAVLMSPDNKYEKVAFTVALDRAILKVSDFNAESQDIRIKGNCEFFREQERVSLDLAVSLSPEIAAKLPSEIREKTLSPLEDGWYSTVISMKGPVALLRAIYSLAA